MTWLGLLIGGIIGSSWGFRSALHGALLGALIGAYLRKSAARAPPDQAGRPRTGEAVPVPPTEDAPVAAPGVDLLPVRKGGTGAQFAPVRPAGAPAAVPAAPAPIGTPEAPAAAAAPHALWAWLTGGNALTRIGVVILFFGVAFLLRYLAEIVTIPIEWRLIGVGVI